MMILIPVSEMPLVLNIDVVSPLKTGYLHMWLISWCNYSLIWN